MQYQDLKWEEPQVGKDTPTSSSGGGGDEPQKHKELSFRNGMPRERSSCDQCREAHRKCDLSGPPSQGCEACRKTGKHCSYMDGQAGASAPMDVDPAVSYQATPEEGAQEYAELPWYHKRQQS
ncbi:hypothetical protein PV04_10447 [Phialophora macrospora]|uniref:Zn(2)-C6 fungal-type domain-containing protein n=1 Tax=Phialophora macrospora TaxID=1851006 RepID=A0A0D2FQH3_9EURO|nr:hypothetical protein PV04_10447 [Phialophora macrospora]